MTAKTLADYDSPLSEDEMADWIASDDFGDFATLVFAEAVKDAVADQVAKGIPDPA